jgi:hypothetical protein
VDGKLERFIYFTRRCDTNYTKDSQKLPNNNEEGKDFLKSLTLHMVI